jgi:hypothetical protein
MSTQTRFVRPDWQYLLLTGIVLFGVAMSVPVVAVAEDDATPATEQRSSASLHVRQGGRENRANGTSTVDTYAELEKSGERVKPRNSKSAGKIGPAATGAESSSVDFWIYEADVVLFDDDDRDGYYHGIDLLIDADTIYSEADVYAAVYLSLEGGPWNEYAVTDDFTIFGASAGDEYVLVTELMSGYPTGSYDLLIELFDAFDGSFLASLGPEESSEIGYLPLEDFNRDTPRDDPPVVVHHGGGGAAGLWLLAPMLLALVRRRWNSSPVSIFA